MAVAKVEAREAEGIQTTVDEAVIVVITEVATEAEVAEAATMVVGVATVVALMTGESAVLEE